MQKYAQYVQLKFCLFLPQKFSMIVNLTSDRKNVNIASLIYSHILIRETYLVGRLLAAASYERTGRQTGDRS